MASGALTELYSEVLAQVCLAYAIQKNSALTKNVLLLGDGLNYQNDYELDKLEVKVSKNGEYLSSGYGSAVQGHPAEAVAWLANTLGKYNIPLLKGEIILSGSLVPLEPAIAGDHFYMELIGIGDCEVYFS